ncbi:MAG TPA: DUF2520 domain-containing protein [Bacteroidales bacterium]|nr:DUF2520 domain-containing protein [Bacteroidales bacterium]
MRKTKIKIALLGAGNVATHLGRAFKNAGYKIVTVYSRTIISAASLGGELNVPFTDNPVDVPEADIYVISVRDDAIETLLTKLNFGDGLVLHTSGAMPIDIFKVYTKNYGVFYPLQTFSRFKDLDFKKIPVLVEADSKESLKLLTSLASSVSNIVQEASSDQRKKIHLAAVFACNFSNHMLAICYKILSDDGLDAQLLNPLVIETFQKALSDNPSNVQTGPAVRGDTNTMKKHLKMLNSYPAFQKIYTFVSESIQDLSGHLK